MHDTTKNKTSRIVYLDGLRGVAALMVFTSHLIISIFPAIITFTPQEVHTRLDISLGLSPLAIFWTGNFAVCIFFILSGFVLADFCQKTSLSFPAQITRRYCRLAIPMLLTSTLAWLLLHFGLYHNLSTATEVTHSGWLSAWYNFKSNFIKMAKEALMGAFIHGNAKYNCNLWTMQLEIIGSIYVFALFALLKNRYLRLVAIIWFIKANYQSYYLLFACGALLFDFQQDLVSIIQRLLPTTALRNFCILIGLLIALYLGAFPDTQPTLVSPWYSGLYKMPALLWHMAGAILLLTVLLQSKELQGLFGSKLGSFLGKISFVVYLIHIPIICSLTSWVLYLTRGLPYYQTAFISILISFVTVISVSKLLYNYVDRSATDFSRWAGKWVDKLFSSEHSNRLESEDIKFAGEFR